MSEEEPLSVGRKRPRIVESDDPVVRVLCGSFELIGNFRRVDETTYLTQVHAGGHSPNALGIKRLKEMARQFLEDQSAQRLIVEGAVRRTGPIPVGYQNR